MFNVPHTRLDRRTRYAAVGAAAIVLGGIMLASCSTGATPGLVDASRATTSAAAPTTLPVIAPAAPPAPSSTMAVAADPVGDVGQASPPVPAADTDVPAPAAPSSAPSPDPSPDSASDPCDALEPDGGALLVGPDPLVLDHGVMEGTITIVNCGDGEIDWTAATKPSVTLDDDGASLLPGNTAELDFVIDAAAWEPGPIEFAIKVSEPGHNRYVDVRAHPQLGLTTLDSIDPIQPCDALTSATAPAPTTC